MVPTSAVTAERELPAEKLLDPLVGRCLQKRLQASRPSGSLDAKKGKVTSGKPSEKVTSESTAT